MSSGGSEKSKSLRVKARGGWLADMGGLRAGRARSKKRDQKGEASDSPMEDGLRFARLVSVRRSLIHLVP